MNRLIDHLYSSLDKIETKETDKIRATFLSYAKNIPSVIAGIENSSYNQNKNHVKKE
jgi:CRISPR/Cas system CMR-associated protein Cmr5 small subunit